MALRSISRCPLGVLRLGVLRPKPPVNPRGKRFLHDDGASDAFDKDKLKAIVTVHGDMIKTEMKDWKHSVRKQIHEGVEAMQQTLSRQSNILFRGAILVLGVSFASGGYFLLTPVKDYITALSKESAARTSLTKESEARIKTTEG